MVGSHTSASKPLSCGCWGGCAPCRYHHRRHSRWGKSRYVLTFPNLYCHIWTDKASHKASPAKCWLLIGSRPAPTFFAALQHFFHISHIETKILASDWSEASILVSIWASNFTYNTTNIAHILVRDYPDMLMLAGDFTVYDVWYIR